MITIKPAGKNELTNSLPAFTLWSGGLAPPKMEGKPPLLSDFPYFALYHTRLCQATKFYTTPQSNLHIPGQSALAEPVPES